MKCKDLEIDLSPFVRGIWTSQNEQLGGQPQTFRFFADGYPGLMFHRSNHNMILNGNKQLSTLLLYGQTVKPIEISVVGSYQIAVVHLQPNTLKKLFGIPAHELTDSCLDLSLFSEYRDLIDELLATRTESDQRLLFKQFLQSLIVNSRQSDDFVVKHAIETIMNSSGTTRLRGLHRELAVSERTFERKFEQHVGVSPRQFAKICRFQASLSRIHSKEYSRLSDIAFDLGFADQSHFLRSFKEFTNSSPSEYLKTVVDA